jgi:quercetin dioxygenase-like cupin family protein
MFRFVLPMLAVLALPAAAADPDPATMVIKRDADIVWTDNPIAPGLKTAVVYGDPAAPGVYIIRVRFAPGTMSPPHFHPEARYIVVLKGT